MYGIFINNECYYVISGQGTKWYARPTALAKQRVEEFGLDIKSPSFKQCESEAEAVACALRLGAKYGFHGDSDRAFGHPKKGPAPETIRAGGLREKDMASRLAAQAFLAEAGEEPQVKEAPAKPKKAKKDKE